MLPSKPKSGISETANNKTIPATPRVSKLGRAGSTKSDSDSPSPLQNSRLSIDRSPRSVDSKPTVERRSPKITTPLDKQPKTLKGSELQAQLGVVQEDLKKAKERLASVEKEKARAFEELKDAKRSADEANEKVKEALVAQKRAEESSEIEKFRAVELEQAGIEAAQKREEEWQKELDSVRNQHAVDVAALLSTTQEVQRVKHELAMISDAKNTALSHADDAMKIAEINAEKVELLSAEVSRLKALLDTKLESKTNEDAELLKKLNSEVDALKHELERTKAAEEKSVEMEALIERLQVELTNAKKAELDVANLADEWKKNADLFEVRVEEANQSERSALDSLASAMEELEESNASLQDAESEIAALKGKVESLEIEITRYKEDLEESDQHLDMAKQEAIEMGKAVEGLKSELQIVEAAKMQALNNEKVASSSVESLSEERQKLINELETTRDEGEKVKKAMEGLASALHEVSTEARETQERLLTKQAEVENALAQMEELKLALKNTEESYEVMLDETKYEIVCLRKSVDRYEMEAKNSTAEWDTKELNFVGAIKKSEEEIAAIKVEMEKVVDSLKGAELEAQAAKEDGIQLMNKLRQAESEATVVDEALEESKAESSRLKERLLDKENELQNISQENVDLRIREAAALEKVKELSALLGEVTAKKTEANGELSNSEKEYDTRSKTIEFSEDNAGESETEKPMPEIPSVELQEWSREDPKPKAENGNVNGNAAEKEPVEVEVKILESCKSMDKELSSEREPEAESVDDELDSKVDSASFDHINGLSSENMDNGGSSPTKQQQKKKKALLHKFGSLLKKKSNHK